MSCLLIAGGGLAAKRRLTPRPREMNAISPSTSCSLSRSQPGDRLRTNLPPIDAMTKPPPDENR
jgi:hypothetical protein